MTASTGIAETEALLVLLRREHELLLAGDLEGIEAIAREKHAAIEQLERLNLDTLHLARPGNDSGARL
ncbi:MAG: hypothetical protein OEV31_01920, partial [Gammaproteobacteria bacterium]|nr:hypothetical protein [Gammaproteobacteria bacterium]